jgi:hypothetical protein
VLRMEEEGRHSWELCGFTSALSRGISCFLEKTKLDANSEDSLWPGKVYLKVVGNMVANKSLLRW